MESVIGMDKQVFIQMAVFMWQIWLPCPYMLLILTSSSERMANVIETWYTASGTPAL